MIKGVIFDLDGVLVSTDELHFEAWSCLANKLGIKGFSKEDNQRQKGVSRMESLEIVLEKADEEYTQEQKQEFANVKNEIYVTMLDKLTKKAVLSEVEETLSMLRSRGIKIGVGSVSKNTPLILQKTGLLPFIDEVSCGLDITKSKPDPEVFLVAAKKLNLSPHECLVVEDSEAGIVAAKAAGMHNLGVGPECCKLGAEACNKTLLTGVDWDELLK